MSLRTVEMPEMLASFSVVTLEMVENSETFIKIIGYRYGKKIRQNGREVGVFPFFNCFLSSYKIFRQPIHLTYFTFN
jgi:hypothetical protein